MTNKAIIFNRPYLRTTPYAGMPGNLKKGCLSTPGHRFKVAVHSAGVNNMIISNRYGSATNSMRTATRKNY